MNQMNTTAKRKIKIIKFLTQMLID